MSKYEVFICPEGIGCDRTQNGGNTEVDFVSFGQILQWATEDLRSEGNCLKELEEWTAITLAVNHLGSLLSDQLVSAKRRMRIPSCFGSIQKTL